MVTLRSNGDDPPEFYVDSVRIAANVYSFIFELGVQGSQRVACLRGCWSPSRMPLLM